MTLWLLLIAHFIGDFTLQSAWLAEQKTQKCRFLLRHALIYAIVLATAAFLFVPAAAVWMPFLIMAGSHLVIDWIRVYVDKKSRSPAAHYGSFLTDQLIHLGIMIAMTRIFRLNEQILPWVSSLAGQVPLEMYIRYALIFVIVLDPAAVFVKKLTIYVSGKSNQKKEAPIGRVIGKLERIIIATLVICGQIGAIGFVLTAKSLARYKQLNEQDFAEKYLIGTLSSTAIAIAAAMLLR